MADKGKRPITEVEETTILHDACCMLGATRSSLHVVAAERGVVVGNIVFSDDGDAIDCTKMGIGGKGIPPNIDRVTDMTSDAFFILLVDKHSTFSTLAQDRFYRTYPCIIVTTRGQPDMATRLFVRKMRIELKLPIFALTDCDPYGLRILSVYDSVSLATPDIFWLGVLPSDLMTYKIPQDCLLPMTEDDLKEAKDLLKGDFIKKHPKWRDELLKMVKMKKKAEIEAFSVFDLQYLTKTFLPSKLQHMN